MSINISVPDGLNLDRIAESGQCFRWEKTAEGWRIPHLSHCLRVRALSGDTFELDCGEAEFESVWKPYFDLSTSYRRIAARVRKRRDPFLYEALKAQRGMRILRQDFWETLVSFLISQNRNIPQIRKSVRLLCALAGEKRADSRGEAYFAFPSPRQVSAMSGEALSACRLGYREKYVRAAAEAACSGSLDADALSRLDDGACADRLLGLSGVGKKVAACVLLFGLHRLDAFPVDVWMRRVLENEYPRGYPGDEYSPYNGFYQQVLFARYRELHGGARRQLSRKPCGRTAQ